MCQAPPGCVPCSGSGHMGPGANGCLWVLIWGSRDECPLASSWVLCKPGRAGSPPAPCKQRACLWLPSSRAGSFLGKVLHGTTGHSRTMNPTQNRTTAFGFVRHVTRQKQLMRIYFIPWPEEGDDHCRASYICAAVPHGRAIAGGGTPGGGANAGGGAPGGGANAGGGAPGGGANEGASVGVSTAAISVSVGVPEGAGLAFFFQA